MKQSKSNRKWDYKYMYDYSKHQVLRCRQINVQKSFLENSEMSDDILVETEVLADVKGLYVDNPKKILGPDSALFVKPNQLYESPAIPLRRLRNDVISVTSRLTNHHIKIAEAIKIYENKK